MSESRKNMRNVVFAEKLTRLVTSKAAIGIAQMKNARGEPKALTKMVDAIERGEMAEAMRKISIGLEHVTTQPDEGSDFHHIRLHHLYVLC